MKMKTLKMILLVMIISLFTGVLQSQVSVGINIGTPRYYYLQDIEAYYDIQASMYIYLFGGIWHHARVLPASYGHYDLNNGHRVIIRDYRGNRPYNYFNEHRSRFPKGHYDNSPDKNYWSMKEHRAQGRGNKAQGKEYKKEMKRNNKEFKKENKRQNKEFKKEEKRNNKGNGNNGNGRGNGKGNGGGNGKGNGNGGGNGHGKGH
jgi:hypothetical protein